MSYQKLTEEEVKLRYITPAIEEAGWDKHSQIRMEYHFTDGEMLIRDNKAVRGKPKFADYLLFYESNIPLAIVEAKDNTHAIGDGIQQAINYYYCDFGVVLSNKISSIKKEGDIIFVPPKTFSFI